MRRVLRRVVLAVAVMSGAMLTVTAPADAGGPTSVLLTNPGEGRAAAIYASDRRYAELEELLHGAGSSGSEPAPPEAGATYVNVTWLAHDVSVWRTDRVMMQADGQVWVDTTNVYGEGSLTQSEVWTRVADADRFRRLVTSLGLVGPGPARTDPAETTPQIVPEPQASASPATVVQEETRWFSLTGWRWAVPGLLAGLFAAAVVRGRRTDPAAPRRELIEGVPERITSPG